MILRQHRGLQPKPKPRHLVEVGGRTRVEITLDHAGKACVVWFPHRPEPTPPEMLRHLHSALRAFEAEHCRAVADLPALTPEELANGWTPETLHHYRQERAAAEAHEITNRLFPDKPPLRVANVAGFDPHGW